MRLHGVRLGARLKLRMQTVGCVGRDAKLCRRGFQISSHPKQVLVVEQAGVDLAEAVLRSCV